MNTTFGRLRNNRDFCFGHSEQFGSIIGNSWILANGDPLGKHEMDIYIEGEYVTTFEFVVGLTGDSY